MQRWHGNAGRTCGGVGNVEQIRHRWKTNGGAGRFLDANSGARARNGVGTSNRVGRIERQIGAYSGNTGRGDGFSAASIDEIEGQNRNSKREIRKRKTEKRKRRKEKPTRLPAPRGASRRWSLPGKKDEPKRARCTGV